MKVVEFKKDKEVSIAAALKRKLFPVRICSKKQVNFTLLKSYGMHSLSSRYTGN